MPTPVPIDYYLEELTAPPSTIHATTRGVAEMLI